MIPIIGQKQGKCCPFKSVGIITPDGQPFILEGGCKKELCEFYSTLESACVIWLLFTGVNKIMAGIDKLKEVK